MQMSLVDNLNKERGKNLFLFGYAKTENNMKIFQVHNLVQSD